MRAILLCLVGALLLSSHAMAASIQLKSVNNGIAYILISGPLVLSDVDDFRGLTKSYDRAVVGQISNGGRLQAGLGIGTIIRSKKYDTMIPDNRDCMSACALAWMGGAKRFAGPRSHIGFHAAYQMDDDGIARESGSANAFVGSYLTRLGLSDDAIYFLTSAPPDDFQYLTLGAAKEYGIDFILTGGPVQPPRVQAKAGPKTPAAQAKPTPAAQRDDHGVINRTAWLLLLALILGSIGWVMIRRPAPTPR